MMDTNPPHVCRLCLLTGDDVVNIWELFEDSSIASILAKHFWFQVHKNDGLTEWLCKICWIQTKTFHQFYKKVEQFQKSLWDSVDNGTGEPDENASVVNKAAVSESEFYLVKCEETEETKVTVPTNDIPDYSDENISDQISFLPGETDRITGDKDQPSVKKLKINDDIDSSNKSKKERQNAQIREFFNMKCEICSDVEFQALPEVTRHYRNVHKINGYLMCCGKKFFYRKNILEHIVTHVNPDAFRCEQCGKSFRNKYALDRHIENHVPLDSRAHKCSLCASSFSKGYLLKHHVKTKHASKTGEKFPCDKCDKNFRSKILLACHMRCVHSSLEHVCETCARRFKTKQLLDNHIISQHSSTPKVQCDICGAWLKNKEILKKHLKFTHQDGHADPLKCPMCNKLVKNKRALTNHIRCVHGERRHQCVLCDKAFKCAKNLKEHIAGHTGEHLYNCPYCEKKFNSNANLYSHRKKAHLVEWSRDSTQRDGLIKGATSEEREPELNT